MLAGLPNEHIDQLHLDPETDYFYTGRLDEMTIDGIDDATSFKRTQKALDLIGLSKKERDDLFQILAGILHLGQLEFEHPEGSDDASQVVNCEELDIVGELLGLSADYIEEACCNRTVRARDEEYTVPLVPNDASESRDALAKAIYSRLFDWIVTRMNEAIGASDERVSGEIGVLDIFGFEDFARNGFEQFCINYANEKLQQKFTMDVFKSVEKEYVREGLDWNHIDFKDNEGILRLIEAKMGIIAIMNDHLRQPRATE